MVMSSYNTTQGIVQVILPTKDHYLHRLKALDIALKKEPDSQIIPFLNIITHAQNSVLNELLTANIEPQVSEEAPHIKTQNLAEDFNRAASLLVQSILKSLESLKSNDSYSEIIGTLTNLQEELKNPQQSTTYFQEIINLDLESLPASKRIFLLTAMQTTLLFEAIHCTINPEELLQNKEACPCCNMPAVSSVLDNSEQGLRYLYCSFCETKWHVVRSTCTVCESNQFLYQDKIEELESPMYAEVCDECHSYLKFLDRSKTPSADPFIEDLITLSLSLKLSNTQYKTFGLNPYLI